MDQKGRGLCHVIYTFQFWNPLLFLDRLKLQTSNFAGGLRVTASKQKKYKTGLKGVSTRSGDLLLNLDVPGISGKAEATKFKFCRWIKVKGQ